MAAGPSSVVRRGFTAVVSVEQSAAHLTILPVITVKGNEIRLIITTDNGPRTNHANLHHAYDI